MEYDFDKLINRRHTNSLKWDIDEQELPMWVADMDFETAPEIRSAIQKRLDQGIFGYSIIPEGWNEAYVNWWEKRHGFHMEKEWLTFTTGVIPAISSIIRKLTTPGENVLIQTPVYHIFFNSIKNNGREVLENRLKYDGKEYHIDFEDLENKLAMPQTTMMLLCNPQNPSGNLWDRETLEKIGELCWKYHVIVVADEIHCDLADPGYNYIPFASVSDKCRENSVTCLAPTKAFNLAGFKTAAVSVPNQEIRRKVRRGLNTDEVAEANIFAVDAAVAAFNESGDWLDELNDYIFENRQYVREYIKNEIPNLKVVESHSTYLLWVDCMGIAGSAVQMVEFIREKTGLYLSEGGEFGGNGRKFFRMNIGCPRKTLEDGLKRLKQGVMAYEEWAGNLC